MRKLQKNTAAITAITAFFACLTLFVKPASVIGRVSENFSSIPYTMGEWDGYDIETKDFLESVPNSSLLMRDYVNQSASLANLTIVYGRDIADIHKPEYCFEGQGWQERGQRVVSVRSAKEQSHPARLLFLTDPQGTGVVCLYWYAGSGDTTDSLASQRINVWKQAIFSRKVKPSALVRILVPVTTNEDQAIKDAISLASSVDQPVMSMLARGVRQE